MSASSLDSGCALPLAPHALTPAAQWTHIPHFHTDTQLERTHSIDANSARNKKKSRDCYAQFLGSVIKLDYHMH